MWTRGTRAEHDRDDLRNASDLTNQAALSHHLHQIPEA
jgi:hypothetical protein